MAAPSYRAWFSRSFCIRGLYLQGQLKNCFRNNNNCILRTDALSKSQSVFDCTSSHLGSWHLYSTYARRGDHSHHSKEDDYNEEDEHSAIALDQQNVQHRHDAVNSDATEDGSEFSKFPLDPTLLRRLNELGYKKPFAIQTETLEHTLVGRDVIGRAITGSGKTLAFAIPIVQKILQSPRLKRSRSPRAIVISPTRELCNQIYRSIRELDPTVRCVALYGGASFVRQEREIFQGVDVVCATPGRLNDHIQRRTIGVNELQFLCLDEADELLTPNFKDQIQDLLDDSPRDKQMMLFSATMPPDIVHMTKRYMREPIHVDITKSQNIVSPPSVKHQCIRAPRRDHMRIVSDLITEHSPTRCIIFLKTKVQASDAARELQAMGVRAEAIHSDLSQNHRERILLSFRRGLCKILTATDVAARGLDIPEVDLVLQVEPPANGIDYYIHRSGRTGRAGRDGLAVLIHEGTFNDMKIVRDIARCVKLEQIRPPNSEDTVEKIVESTVEQLNSVPEDLLKHTREAAAKLDLNGEQGEKLMAAALALILKKSLPAGFFNKEPLRQIPPHSHYRVDNKQHYHNQNKSHTFKRQNRFEYGRDDGFRNRPRRTRTLNDNDDDDELY
ncbi:PREDICTED: DEAD-box ATP-dependent RNA helicase CshA-like [Priapulus caudatus]|uniref:RNA helicase n=1 Tax=Priapulus caudatus TaxID=37621 RepID=A0ABM1E6L1_PRICU|nr:PREDICTED: DEAD-box ATP-dependent RNA helicase CshA-like [Priapulus caudatus]